MARGRFWEAAVTGVVAWAAAAGALEAQTAAATAPAPIVVAHTSEPIAIDGDLSDAAWAQATVLDAFYEYTPGDNVAPKVRTRALLAYDREALYVGVWAEDPQPHRIRAPYVERDQVFGDQDNLAVFLDTRGDRRTALQLRQNPRGVQGDALNSDVSNSEDFAPDFFYDTAARIGRDGWSAEFRIPLRSLRFESGARRAWGFMIIRNYPREFRYQMSSVKLPRGGDCLVCRMAPLAGIDDLPPSGGLVAAPYVSARDGARAATPGAPLEDGSADAQAGLDVKWTPSADTAVDVALHPDFSQVESDVAQIAVNSRFALFFPEKRPFFLESVDLLATPLDVVYTRTLTDPRWGARATGRLGAASYTALVAEDEGGGSVILPGPVSSSLAPQDFRSWAGIARLRRELGGSFASFLATARAIEGGGHNLVAGPDFQWRRRLAERITGQLLLSDTRTPERPALAGEWDGRRLRSHALRLSWVHAERSLDWRASYSDVGAGFRADLGFVPQVGYRQVAATLGSTRYRERGFLARVRPFLDGFATLDRRGRTVSQQVSVGADLHGQRNLVSRAELVQQRQSARGRLLDLTQVGFWATINPASFVPRLEARAYVGEEVDLAHARVGRGMELSLGATLRPSAHLELETHSALNWLDVSIAEGRRARLFTAQVQRLKATYNFSARAALRLIGQYESTARDPRAHALGVARREGSFSGSALFTYRINWQTALFVGYGDEHTLLRSRLRPSSRELFFKLSYALQR